MINLLSCRGPPNTLFPISHQDVKSHFFGQFSRIPTYTLHRWHPRQVASHKLPSTYLACFLPCLKLTNEFAPENEAGVRWWSFLLGGWPMCKGKHFKVLHLPPRRCFLLWRPKLPPRWNTSFLQGLLSFTNPNFLYYEQITQNYQQQCQLWFLQNRGPISWLLSYLPKLHTNILVCFP